MKLMRSLLPAAALCLFAAGCTTWYNPNLVNQDNQEVLLKRDTAYCEDHAKELTSTGPMNAQQFPTVGMRNEVGSYALGKKEVDTQDDIFLKCMKSRGWQRKK